jgi:hypothetical protein
MDDLKRLAQFVASLLPALSMSQPVERLHRLCQVLHQVAALYVEARAKAKQQDQEEMSMLGNINDFDMYLSQLGLVPRQTTTTTTTTTSSTDFGMLVDDDESAQQLAGWFSGNSHVMGLMEEEDLSEFLLDVQ